MKYKQDFITKLDAALNLTQTVNDALNNGKPYTQQELSAITRQIERILEFLLERIELEKD